MYSSAFNNYEQLSGSADPKTGTYSFQHVFDTVQADGRFGPKCNLTMSYSLLSTMNAQNATGLGKGWSFKTGSYAKESNILTLNTGASYKVLRSSPNHPWILSTKLKGMHVEVVTNKQTSSEELHISHKNGDKEIMDMDTRTGDAVLSKFISGNGRYLEFKYQQEYGYQRLVSVHDKDHCLATITYDDNGGEVKVSTHPKTQDERTTTLQISSGGYLEKIELPCGEHISIKYKIADIPSGRSGDRTMVNLHKMERVTYSTGASEVMEYDAKLSLPIGAPLKYTPAITKHTKTVATDLDPIVTKVTYEEDGNNYWGNHAGITWEDFSDGLLNLDEKYRYSSKTVVGNKVTKFEYNKFHQVVSKVETNGDENDKIITTYEYYSHEEKPLLSQPTTYELLKKETTRYQHTSGTQNEAPQARELVKSYEYDDWGNVTVETDHSGIRTVSEYYQPEGENGCPPHPFKMMVYVKKRTHHPTDNTANKVYTFTYQSIPRLGGETFIVPSTKTIGNVVKKFTYFDQSNPKLQGVPKSETVTCGSKGTTKSCNYKFEPNKVYVTDTITGFDGATLSTSETLSIWTGLTMEETDEAGVKTMYVHDKLGRLVSEVSAAGTEYEIKTTYTYEHNPKDPLTGKSHIGTNVVQATSTGATVHTFYDGEHRELAVYQKDDYNTLRKVSENKYDNQGRKVFDSQLDYVLSRNQVQNTMSQTATYEYDSWGQRSSTHYDNGISEIVENDPIALTTTHQMVCRSADGKVVDSLNKVETTHNLFGSPVSRKVFLKTGQLYSTMSIAYDGFGRKIEVTTPTGSNAKITKYDDFDRPSQFEHYDQTLFQITYADHSVEPLVGSISVPSLKSVLAQQEYDGLSRVTSKTVSGAKTQFSYKGGFSRPSRRLNAKGQATLFEYIPELEMQISRVASFTKSVALEGWEDRSKLSDAVFTYSKKSDASRGSILNATTSTPQQTTTTQRNYDYFSTGKVKTTVQTVGKVSQTLTNKESTMEGRPVITMIGNRKTCFTYDNHGHVVSTTEGDMKTEISLDKFGRVSSKLVKQYNSATETYDLLQTTETSYDEHSRETTRTIKAAKTAATISIRSEYDTEDKIVRRSISFSKVGSLTESFSYDKKRRLVKYSADQHTSDAMLPRNENKKPFLSQCFTYDALDNIKTIKTSFPGDETDTATLDYDKTHKQVLTQITHTLTTGENPYPPSIKFEYDADGNLILCGSMKMSYTVSGRLSKVNNNSYTYDAFERLVQSNDTTHIYSNIHVVQELDSTGTTDIIRFGGIPVAEVRNGEHKLYGVDQKLSVMCLTDTNTTFSNYSPYGSGHSDARVGLNGEMRDITDSNMYHLGNGIRTYIPAFCRFSSSDTYSPFMGGGINPYKYCGNDPINAIDPSGHISWQAILGAFVAVAALVAVPFTGGSSLAIAVGAIAGIAGVVSSGLEIGAEIAAEKGNTELSKKLGTASMFFGVASTLLSIGQIAANVYKVAKAGMAAKPALKSVSNMVSADSDDMVTTGYKVRFTAARQRNTLSGSDKKFMVLKTKKGKFKTPSIKNRISEKKFGRFYLRTVREPIRVMKGGKYAGMSNILSKSTTFREVFTSAGLMGAPLMNVVSYFTKFEDYASGEGDEDESGSESQVNLALCSAYGLPSGGRAMGAERMLFYYM